MNNYDYKFKCFYAKEKSESDKFIKSLGNRYIEDWYQTEVESIRVRVVKYIEE